MDNKLNILYTLKGIHPYEIKGYVELLLVPVDKMNMPKQKKMNIVPFGGQCPPEVMEQMSDMIAQMTGRRDPEDDRQIILLEDEMMFQKRGWRYGDIISCTFEKIEDK